MLAMIYTHSNLKFCIGLTFDDYTQWRDTHGEDGFRTHALSMAGPASQPLYTAVMVKDAQPFRCIRISSRRREARRTRCTPWRFVRWMRRQWSSPR
jgi:hypothetical protein